VGVGPVRIDRRHWLLHKVFAGKEVGQTKASDGFSALVALAHTPDLSRGVVPPPWGGMPLVSLASLEAFWNVSAQCCLARSMRFDFHRAGWPSVCLASPGSQHKAASLQLRTQPADQYAGDFFT